MPDRVQEMDKGAIKLPLNTQLHRRWLWCPKGGCGKTVRTVQVREYNKKKKEWVCAKAFICTRCKAVFTAEEMMGMNAKVRRMKR
jgi:hypothetical protein